MTYTPLNMLEEGKSYDQTFLVESVSPKRVRSGAKAGSPYLLVMVRDVTGRMKAFVWDTSIKDACIRPGQYVYMNAEVRAHQGDKTLVTHGISVARRPSDLEPYVRGESDHSLKIYAEELTQIVERIDDPDYLRIVTHAIDHSDYLTDMQTFAFGTRGPLSHVGGLIVHTIRTCRMAQGIINACPDIDAPLSQGLVLAGCMLRNWGYIKVLELNGDAWTVNEDGKYLGLRFVSSLMVSECIKATEEKTGAEIPPAKKLALQMILSATEEKGVSLLEGKVALAAEKTVNAMHYSGKLFREHLS